MATAAYITPAAYLDMQLRQQGIPIVGVSGPPWSVQYDSSATQAQRDQGDALAAAFDGKGRTARTLNALYQDIAKLTTTQQDKIWADLSAPVAGVAPRKLLTDDGPNAASLFIMDFLIGQMSMTAPALRAAHNDVAAFWTQDHVLYLVNPPFDPTINVPGGDPYPP